MKEKVRVQHVPKIPKLEVGNPRAVFLLFAALNAMGYGDQNNTAGANPIRKRVRNVLLKCDWKKKYPKLTKAIKARSPWYLLRAILAGPRHTAKTSILASFLSDLRKFGREPLLENLWQGFKIYQAKETKKLFPVFVKETTRLLKFIGRPPKEIKKIILIANPLDAHYSGYSFGGRVGHWTGSRSASYIVVGPGAENNQGELIRHELLHFLAPAWRLPPTITTVRSHKKLATMGYDSRSIINR